ncbi:MAG: hypothetical protein JSR21_10525 [Proteobacteria bacterium]|nr:hypothetical protein [Pseudomonadota bacterium]
MLRRAAFAAVTALALGCALAQPAAAQINPFRSSFANGLGDDDFQRLSDASNALLNREHLEVGATEAWRNPATGAGGTITVTRNFTARGYACHALLYSSVPDEKRASRQTRLNWCKTPEGWKIL